MEYTIYNESLVYYALRNEKGNYFSLNESKNQHLHNCIMFDPIEQAQNVQKTLAEDFTQIRKVKVIDIGEISEEI